MPTYSHFLAVEVVGKGVIVSDAVAVAVVVADDSSYSLIEMMGKVLWKCQHDDAFHVHSDYTHTKMMKKKQHYSHEEGKVHSNHGLAHVHVHDLYLVALVGGIDFVAKEKSDKNQAQIVMYAENGQEMDTANDLYSSDCDGQSNHLTDLC